MILRRLILLIKHMSIYWIKAFHLAEPSAGEGFFFYEERREKWLIQSLSYFING